MSDSAAASKSFLWMTVGLFIGVGVLVGGGFLMAQRFVHSVGLSAVNNATTTARTSKTSFRLERENEIGPGMPVYPRAALLVPEEDKAIAYAREAQNGTLRVTYISQDSRDAISDWYKSHLGPEFSLWDSNTPLPEALRNANVSQTDIVFTAQRGAQLRVVALTENVNNTQISLLRFDPNPQP